jgi:inner membrane protein
MDNLCHTLVGAACGEAGLKRTTRWANPILMIAANLPDIDVLAFATGTPAVAIRRGWTHGVLAQALLPILLTAVVLALDRWRPAKDGRPRVRAGPVLLLAYVGVLSHVGLDWLNTYGVRLLMPFSNRWFYGDSVFIIDPWLWLLLAIGVLLARRYVRPARAAVALVVTTVYIGAMVGSARVARAHVLEQWTTQNGAASASVMVGPSLVNPLTRNVIIDAGDHYRYGTYEVLSATLWLVDAAVWKNETHPAVLRARDDPRFRAVLVWARFPYYEIDAQAGGTRVRLADMRFGPRVGSVSTIVPSVPE